MKKERRAFLATAQDPDFPAWGIHFEITDVAQEKRPAGETRYTMRGAVTNANDPAKIGLSVRIIAETVGDTTAIAIALGDVAFGGAGIISIELLHIALIYALATLIV